MSNNFQFVDLENLEFVSRPPTVLIAYQQVKANNIVWLLCRSCSAQLHVHRLRASVPADRYDQHWM
jgi:hypothetical protein